MITNRFINKLKLKLARAIGRMIRETVSKIKEPAPNTPERNEVLMAESPEFFQETDRPP